MSERATRECTMSPTMATVRLREVALEVADRVHVEQPLRRVRMAAVAGVDHVHVRRAVLGDQVGRAALAVAHDEHVGVHRRQVGDGVEQALALGRATERAMSRLMTSARQALGGDLEGGAGARAVLEEQVEHALAAQQRHLLDVAVVDAEEGAGGVQDLRQDGRGRPSIDSRWISSPLALSCGLRRDSISRPWAFERRR